MQNEEGATGGKKMRAMSKHFTEEEIHTDKKCMERCFTSFIIKEMQIKTTMTMSAFVFASPSRVGPLR